VAKSIRAWASGTTIPKWWCQQSSAPDEKGDKRLNLMGYNVPSAPDGDQKAEFFQRLNLMKNNVPVQNTLIQMQVGR